MPSLIDDKRQVDRNRSGVGDFDRTQIAAVAHGEVLRGQAPDRLSVARDDGADGDQFGRRPECLLRAWSRGGLLSRQAQAPRAGRQR